MSGRRRSQDHFGRRAKKEHYPARSVYKLKEIDQRIKLLRSNMFVLDLGAAPGSWTLFLAKRVGPGGRVVAVDRSHMTINLPAHVTPLCANALDVTPTELLPLISRPGFDLVVSDMAPKTSGHRFVDQTRSFNLYCRALELAGQMCATGGHFVGKIFVGEDFEEARARTRALFSKVKIVRPKSVRSESYETYIVGLDRKTPVVSQP